MKINGEFVMREIAGETVLVPVGNTALMFNGMIILNPVSAVIWQGVEQGLDREEIAKRILDRFEVEEAEAKSDMEEFLEQLKEKDLLTE